MRFSQQVTASLACVVGTANAWTWVAPSLIQSFAASAPAGLTTAYQPLLRVENGCVPFPAVDTVDAGRASEGLKLEGTLTNKCGSNTGQIYSRSGTFGGKFGIMYAWYFPKDQVIPFLSVPGHRHDWEGMTVWYNSATDQAGAELLAICVARHGNGQDDNHCDKSGSFKLSGTRPKIVYKPDGTHALFTYSGNDGLGGNHPLIDWSRLPGVARTVLNEADFGDATPPFKDSVFEGNMLAAKAAAGI